MKKILLISMITLSLSTGVFADDFGHEGINDTNADVEAMLEYALEDEVLAYSTYEAIVNAFDVTRPFTNIMKAEENHIGMVEALMTTYGMAIPEVDPSDYITLPGSLDEAFYAGVKAEIDNIALYEKFLEDNQVPDDVREVFEYLIAGSENHLNAFERQVDRTNQPSNRGVSKSNENNRTSNNGSFRGKNNRNF